MAITPKLPKKLLAEAERVHARLLELKRQKNKANVELAYLLAQVKREKLYRAKNKTSVAEYAVFFGFTRSPSHANDMVRMVEHLRFAPGLRADFEKGDLEWTKVRTAAAAVVAGGDEKTWRDRVPKHTGKVLEEMAAEEGGDPAPVRWSGKFSRQDFGDVEEALKEARAQAGRELSDGEALAFVCRAWRSMQAGGGGAGRSSKNPANRIVLCHCTECDKTWRETRSGQVAVSPERYEAAACDAEVSDVRGGPARITKTVPPRIRRHVLDRAGHRCSVPGCTSVGYLHVHHEPGREATGHDPDRMTPMCDEHHGQRHEGLLLLREEGQGRFRFFHADGTEITGKVGEVAASGPSPTDRPGEAPTAVATIDGGAAPGRSRELPAEAQAPAAEERATTDQAPSSAEEQLADVEGVARRALAKLGMRQREAVDAVKRAREALVARGDAITIETLVREALPS